MADRHESDGRESPESPQAGRSGELHPVTSGAMSTERDDTHVAAENEYLSALDLEEAEEELDLAQIHADDALLDALSNQLHGTVESQSHTLNGHGPHDHDDDGFDDEQLNALLLAWRQDVDSVPVPEIVDAKTAAATVTASKSARRRRPRMLVPVAAAAAVLAIAFAGVGMAARDAEPGDALWGLSKVLYADHARSVEAAQSVRTDLNDAQQALEQGRINEAKEALDEAGTALSEVSTEDGKDALQAKHESLLELIGPSVPPTAPGDRSETSSALLPSASTTQTPSVPVSESPVSKPPTNTPSVTPSGPTGPASGTEPSLPAGNGPVRSDTQNTGTGGVPEAPAEGNTPPN
jgi:hypothetical protein